MVQRYRPARPACFVRGSNYTRAPLVLPGLLMRVLQDVTPTPEQLVILTDSGPGFRLIRGAAGSGKTTAALLRLRQLCSARMARKRRLAATDPIRVLVLTFNRTLSGYVEHLAREQVDASAEISLEVKTFARWAIGLCEGSPQAVDDDDRSHRLRALLTAAGLSRDLEYFVGEVQYILGRWLRSDRDQYLRAERSGRGRAPAVPRALRAKLLVDVVAAYEQQNEDAGLVDWNDVALQAARAPSQEYDVVVVDEAQDLSANQIRAILAHLADDHTTTFIIDAVQRIYPQAFRWREAGVEIRPNQVFALRENHRNTRATAQFAASLVRDLPDDEDGVVPDPDASVREGARPKVVVGKYSAQLAFMLDSVSSALHAGETIAILQPRGGGWFTYAKQELRRRNISFCMLTRSRDWPTGPELVALSTIHSAKGLEFDHVLLPGLNREVTPHGDEEGDGVLEGLRRLVAMGVGRARQTVMLGYKPGERSTVLDFADPDTFDLIEVD